MVSPGRLVATIRPSCAATTAATMASPRPVLPAAPRARGVAAGEPLEDVAAAARRDARAVVGDRRGPPCPSRPTAQSATVGARPGCGCGRWPAGWPAPGAAGPRRRHQRAGSSGTSSCQWWSGPAAWASLTASTTSRVRSTCSRAERPAGVEPGQQQQVLDQGGHPVGLGLDPAQRVRDVGRQRVAGCAGSARRSRGSTASGVRSSWLASATNWRTRVSLPAGRCSASLDVVRASGSAPRRPGRPRCAGRCRRAPARRAPPRRGPAAARPPGWRSPRPGAAAAAPAGRSPCRRARRPAAPARRRRRRPRRHVGSASPETSCSGRPVTSTSPSRHRGATTR